MKRLFLTIFILSITCASFVYSQEIVDYDKEDVHYLRWDIDRDGIEEEIDVVAGEIEREGVVCVLRVKDKKEISTKAIRIEFSHSYNLSLVEISPNLEPFIGIDYGIGAHGYALTLFRYTEQGINQYILEETATFLSDRPSIQIKDVNGDGVKEIVTLGRDYDNNPIEDNYIITYQYIDDGRWGRVSVYRTSTDEYMPEDWSKDLADIRAYMQNAERYNLKRTKISK